MSLDPYSLCPCGSGKKLKFCCSDIAADMMKALQLHEGGQSKAALKILEKLHQQQPARAWVATSLAGILMFLEESQAARDSLQPLLQENPDHPLGRILDATAALDLYSFEEARPAIHRAFTKGFKQYPEMIGSLAAGISAQLYDEGCYMAARQHLTFSMRFVREEDRHSIFMRLLDFDSDEIVSYPLRGVHNLKGLEFSGEEQAVYKKALSLSSLGCWHEAAKVARQLSEAHPENAGLWYNIGLFQAWDGNHSLAAECFHRAAEKTDDREFAISCETLAQILDMEDDQIHETCVFFKVESLARWLTILDEQDRIVRDITPETNPNVKLERFLFLDKAPAEVDTATLQSGQLEHWPLILGRVQCFEIQVPGEKAQAVCRVYANPENKVALVDYLNQIAAGQIHEVEHPPQFQYSGYSEYRDFLHLYPQYYIAPENLRLVVDTFEQNRWKQIVEKNWPNLPLEGLDKKTPNEAKALPELSIKLAAAVNVFDAYAAKYKYQLDTEKLKTSLGLPPSEPYLIENNSQVNTCDVLQMLRIPVENLDEDQLELLINRAQLIQHPRFSERVVACILKYPHIVDDQRYSQILHAYIDMARDRFDREAALERIQLAKKWAEESGQKFEETLQWEMRELQFRVFAPNTQEFKDFIDNFYARYIRKLPELEELVGGYLLEQGITPPWMQNRAMNTATVGNSTGVWSPETAPAQTSGKLWLPGQD